jgi:hypothetical protein
VERPRPGREDGDADAGGDAAEFDEAQASLQQTLNGELREQVCARRRVVLRQSDTASTDDEHRLVGTKVRAGGALSRVRLAYDEDAS